MNNELREPRVEPPKVSYRNKEALRQLPRKATYPFRVWAVAASVAMMVGAGLALWSGTPSEITAPIAVSQTTPTIEASETSEHIDTTTRVEVKLNATQITKKARPRAMADRIEPKTESATARPMMAVAHIQIERQEIRLSADQISQITISTTQQIEAEAFAPTGKRQFKDQFFNPFEAFAIDWKSIKSEREKDRKILQDEPNRLLDRLSKIFASNSKKQTEQN